MSKKLKIGIVGLGSIGTTHADAHKTVGEAELAAFCDIDAKRLADKADKFGVKNRFGKYQDLIASDVDAVYVCVPNRCHAEVVIAALKAGKHVFCEKPMAMSAKQGQEMVDAAAKAKGILQIGMVWRQNDRAQVIRDYVEKGLLGDIYHIRADMIRHRGIPGLGGWFTTKEESGGGPMIDLGVHWFDLSMYLSGHWKPTACSAKNYAKFGPRMENYVYTGMWAGPPRLDGKFDVEDYTTGFVRFGEKATLSFNISWAANAQEGGFLELLGDKGGVRFTTNDAHPVVIYTEQEGRLVKIEPQIVVGKQFCTQVQKFLAACRGEMEPVATGEQGVVVMKLLDAIYASSDANAEVKIDV